MSAPTTPDLQNMLNAATPGPWEAIHGAVTEPRTGCPVALTSSHLSEDEDRANARLIAHAPDLAADNIRLREGIEALITDCMTVALNHAKRLKYDNGVYDDTATRLRALLEDQ